MFMLSINVKKHLNKLQQKKFRKEFKEFIVEGVKGVEEALNSEFEIAVIVIEGNLRDNSSMQRIIAKAEKEDILVEYCNHSDVADIQTTDTFPGVLAVISQDEQELLSMTEQKILCLAGVKDPGNLGTIIRTADWFGVENILLSEDCVDLYNHKVVRSTMGSIFHTNVLRSPNLQKDLEFLKKKFDYKIYSLDLHGDDVEKIPSNNKSIYLFGSESHGVPSELENLIDQSYTIPGSGGAESLNLAISVGIVLHRISV